MQAALSLTLTSETNVNVEGGKPVMRKAASVQTMGFDLLVPADKFRQVFHQLVATGLNSLLDRVFAELQEKEAEVLVVYQQELKKEAEEKAKAKAELEAKAKAEADAKVKAEKEEKAKSKGT